MASGTVLEGHKNGFMDTDKKQAIIRDFAKSDNDVGSSDVQIALLTERIREITEHLKANRRDHSSRRGLISMVNRRRKLLDYLNRKDHERYTELIKRLQLRR